MTAPRIAVIGNHKHHHCSESQWARAFEANGCEVVRIQVEDVARAPETNMSVLRLMDAVTYTRTHSRGMYLDESWCDRWQELERAGVRTIGLHLDRFWGLEREHLVHTDAQFRVRTLWTADGGNDARFAAAGVNHRWLTPAVDRTEAEHVGARSHGPDVLFVGSGSPYHEDSYPQRGELVAHLRRTYGDRFCHVGHGGRPVVRGVALNDLYRSAKVVVGDSCFANDPPGASPRRSVNYWSDRIPETIGRGGFLIHPWVPGLASQFDTGRHYVSHVPGDWDDLDAQIGAYLANAGWRDGIAETGRAHVLRAHTWDVRMREVLNASGLAVDTVEASSG